MTVLEQIIKKISGEDVGEINAQNQIEAALLAVAEKVAGSSPFVPITLSYKNGAWTADVSFEDAKAAILAGKTVAFIVSGIMTPASYSGDQIIANVGYQSGGYYNIGAILYTASGLDYDTTDLQFMPLVTGMDVGSTVTVSEAGEWVTTPPAQENEPASDQT